jgi:cystathionine beta-lyase family protein involved in aluminum resistance
MGSLIKNAGGTLAPATPAVRSFKFTAVVLPLACLFADLVMGSLIKNAGGTLAPAT